MAINCGRRGEEGWVFQALFLGVVVFILFVLLSLIGPRLRERPDLYVVCVAC